MIYDLELVPFEFVNWSEYFTLSQKGLTKFVRGIAAGEFICPLREPFPKEFLTLDEWLAERKVFAKICTLRFFRNHRLLIMFHNWRNTIRKSKRTRISLSVSVTVN